MPKCIKFCTDGCRSHSKQLEKIYRDPSKSKIVGLGLPLSVMPCFFFFFFQAYTLLVDEKESNALTFSSLELAHPCGFGQKHLLGQVLAQLFLFN